jgi:hypothetical protein
MGGFFTENWKALLKGCSNEKGKPCKKWKMKKRNFGRNAMLQAAKLFCINCVSNGLL